MLWRPDAVARGWVLALSIFLALAARPSEGQSTQRVSLRLPGGYQCYTYTASERSLISQGRNESTVCTSGAGRQFVGNNLCQAVNVTVTVTTKIGSFVVTRNRTETRFQNCLCATKCIAPVIKPGCFVYNSSRPETFRAVAARYGSTPYGIAQENNITLATVHSGRTTANRQYIVCPEPTRPIKTTACTNPELLQRPCASYTGKAREDCFCSYHANGPWLWPFSATACTQLINCTGGVSLGLRSCIAPEYAIEQPDLPANASGVAFCVAGNDSRPFGVCPAGGRCTSPECLCSEYLLPDGTYQNPFDLDRTHAIKCRDGLDDGPFLCEFGLFDPNDSSCRTFPLLRCPLAVDVEGCTISYATVDIECPATGRRRRLAWWDDDNSTLSSTLSSSMTSRKLQAAPLVKRECNRLDCCTRFFKDWQASFTRIGCGLNACPTCRDGPFPSPWLRPSIRIVGAGDCACQYRGRCPSQIKQGCRRLFPACFRRPTVANSFTVAGIFYCPPAG